LIKKDETTISKTLMRKAKPLKTSLETVIQKNIHRTTRSYGQPSSAIHHHATRIYAQNERANQAVAECWDG
jgi:hypothetical protein